MAALWLDNFEISDFQIFMGESLYYQCEKHASPPGLEPGSLDYRSNALTTKLRRHDEETCSSHPSIRTYSRVISMESVTIMFLPFFYD